MNKLQKLRQQKEAFRQQMLALDALATRENRVLTPEEQTQLDAAIAGSKQCDVDIVRQEAIVEAERNAPAVTASAGHNNQEDRPWATLGEQLGALASATRNPRHMDARIQAALGSSEAVAAEGGILVDEQWAPGIMANVYEESILADRCMTMPMTSASLKMRAVDERSRVDGSRFGGILSFWEGEGDLYTASKPKFRVMDMNAHKLTALTYLTEELLADQTFLTAYNDEVVPLELAFNLDRAIAVGTGAGQPLGFVSSPATIVVAKDAGQATGTVSTTNILNMLTRLNSRSLKNAAFFVNSALIWTQLATLTIGTGTAVKLIYQGPSPTAPYGSLFGVPVIPIEQAAAVGTQGDVMLADLKTYLLARRQGVRADSSIHVAFLTGEVAFRWMMRVDGQPTWNSPLTPLNGSISTSPYVVLASRP